MVKAKPKPKPKPAKPASTSPPAPKTTKRRALTKALVLDILLAKLEDSKTCDWFALSQRLAGGGGKDITGTELHELYHNVVLPGLKDGRALWTDDDLGGVVNPGESGRARHARKPAESESTVDETEPDFDAEDNAADDDGGEDMDSSSEYDHCDEYHTAILGAPASPTPSSAYSPHAANPVVTPARTPPSSSTSVGSHKRKTPPAAADKPGSRKRMQTKRESAAAVRSTYSKKSAKRSPRSSVSAMSFESEEDC